MFVSQMCSETERAWWNSSAERTWNMPYVDWTGLNSARIRWVPVRRCSCASEAAAAEHSRSFLPQGETAYIRVFEERGTPNWGRSRSRSRSRGRYSPPFHNRGSPPRYQSPPRHAMSRHSPPPRRHVPQHHSPPPRHYR